MPNRATLWKMPRTTPQRRWAMCKWTVVEHTLTGRRRGPIWDCREREPLPHSCVSHIADYVDGDVRKHRRTRGYVDWFRNTETELRRAGGNEFDNEPCGEHQASAPMQSVAVVAVSASGVWGASRARQAPKRRLLRSRRHGRFGCRYPLRSPNPLPIPTPIRMCKRRPRRARMPSVSGPVGPLRVHGV